MGIHVSPAPPRFNYARKKKTEMKSTIKAEEGENMFPMGASACARAGRGGAGCFGKAVSLCRLLHCACAACARQCGSKNNLRVRVIGPRGLRLSLTCCG